MSLVIAYADKEKALIVSDGRAGNGNEFYNKTKQINENVIMGYARTVEGVEVVTSIIDSLPINYRNKLDIDDVALMIEDLLSDKPDDFILDADFIFIGKNKNGLMTVYTVGLSTNYELIKEYPEPYILINLCSDIANPRIPIIMKRVLNGSSKPLFNKFSDCIKEVSTFDDTVNSIIFHASLGFDKSELM